MTFAFGPAQGRYYPPFVAIEDAVPSAEVDAILGFGAALGKGAATISTDDGDRLALGYRGSRISWIHPAANSALVFERIEAVAQRANAEHFGFDLTGLTEPLQFTEYEAPSPGYGWHIDLIDAPRSLQRKLSITIQLSDGTDYVGGNLEFALYNDLVAGSRTRGAMLLFPSFQHHRVQPITRGVRRSLVAWIGGPSFR